jgi:hypothetical protein
VGRYCGTGSSDCQLQMLRKKDIDYQQYGKNLAKKL